MVPLCRQIATAYEGGLPVIQTFEIAAGQLPKGRLRDTVTQMADDLRTGDTLEAAAMAQSKYFPSYFIALLAGGERGGRLDVMLRDLAEYYEDRLAMRRQVLHMMAYPMIQLLATWFLGTFALGLINDVIASMSARGAAAFNLDAYFRSYLLFQAKAGVVFGLVFFLCVVLARLGILKWITGLVTTFVWPLAPVTKKLALARFFRSMSLLLGSGMGVVPCIESAAAVAANPYIKRDLQQAVPRVKDGMTLVQAFSVCRCLTPTAREMLFVGEQSGHLEAQLRKVSEYHLAEARHAVTLAAKAATVLIVLGVALLIGFVIITFYVKLYGGMLNAF